VRDTPATDFRCEFDLPKYQDLGAIESPKPPSTIILFGEKSGEKRPATPKGSSENKAWFSVPHDFKILTREEHRKLQIKARNE
jgi:hypothetical protein